MTLRLHIPDSPDSSAIKLTGDGKLVATLFHLLGQKWGQNLQIYMMLIRLFVTAIQSVILMTGTV